MTREVAVVDRYSNTVVEGQSSDIRNEGHNRILVIGNRARQRVEIRGGPACVLGGEKHSALDYELACVR
jgi:hypothetical protein